MTEVVREIRAFLPDGSMPTLSKAQVDAHVDMRVQESVAPYLESADDSASTATTAASTATAARDATLAASTIVGAGRPDIPATMTPEVAALVAAATSGAFFRSTDGPQGAWEWQKRGAVWAVTSGDTGWRKITVPTVTGVTPAGEGVLIRRTQNGVEMVIDRITFTADYVSGSLALQLPTGFRPDRSTYLPTTNYSGVGYKQFHASGATGMVTVHAGGASADFRTQQRWTPPAAWPTTLPDTPA